MGRDELRYGMRYEMRYVLFQSQVLHHTALTLVSYWSIVVKIEMCREDMVDMSRSLSEVQRVAKPEKKHKL